MFVILLLCVVIYCYFKYKFAFWSKRSIPHLQPTIPFGNFGNLLIGKISLGRNFTKLYRKFSRENVEHAGFYWLTQPVYVPIAIQQIKNVLIRDFDHFRDRDIYFNERDDQVGANLVCLRGHRWSKLRAKLTPTFTSGKVKMMFAIMSECSEKFKQTIGQRALANDVHTSAARFTSDLLATSAFGLDLHSMDGERFAKYTHLIFVDDVTKQMKRLIATAWPQLALKLRLVIDDKESRDYFVDLITKTIDYRQTNGYVRNDFMQLLIELMNDGELTLNEVIPQAYAFLVAGSVTSSSIITYALYELACNEEMQEKLRRALGCDELTYEKIYENKFLHQIINETLRKYPPIAILTRKCTKPYKLENSDVVLEKGTIVAIPVADLHMDERLYPNPHEFDPYRFEDTKNIPIFIPFGDGPRKCVGVRFGYMEVKTPIAKLIQAYKVRLSPQTPCKLTMRNDTMILTHLEKILLDFHPV